MRDKWALWRWKSHYLSYLALKMSSQRQKDKNKLHLRFDNWLFGLLKMRPTFDWDSPKVLEMQPYFAWMAVIFHWILRFLRHSCDNRAINLRFGGKWRNYRSGYALRSGCAARPRASRARLIAPRPHFPRAGSEALRGWSPGNLWFLLRTRAGDHAIMRVRGPIEQRLVSKWADLNGFLNKRVLHLK